MWLPAILLLSFFSSGLSECFFPFEYHGTYAVQMAPNQYSEVRLEINKIFPYGTCHRRVDDNLILRDASNGCLRCFHLAIRSANVIQLHTRDPQSSCATNLNDTFKLCPTVDEMSSPQSMNRSRIHELMMYKVKNAANEPHVHQVYCPISGRFSFSYDIDDGTESSVECAGRQSAISNCPYGFGLHLRFNGCSFRQNFNMTFQCLGDWEDHNGNKLMALLDSDAADGERPRFRCAMYRNEPGSGRVYMALSSDSSCHHHLESATRGYERLVLDAVPAQPWPPAVRQSSCQLPDWAQGQWQHSHIDGDTIVYKDVKNFKTHTAKCISGQDEKFVIYSRSQCGEETYNCIWLKKRGDNVMEYQLGLSPSTTADGVMCNPHQYLATGWIAQGRKQPLTDSPCPVAGEYEGIIPATDGQLGAKLYSDCSRPGIMFYSVVSGTNSSEVYEEREYRCLATWSEGNVMYTYTQRRDVLSYECFAGRVMADGRVYIGEAGTDDSCRRRVDPTRTGMLITKIASCYHNIDDNTSPSVPSSTARPPPTAARSAPTLPGSEPTRPESATDGTFRLPLTPSTTPRPWRPVTGVPDGEASRVGRLHPPATALLALPLLFLRW